MSLLSCGADGILHHWLAPLIIAHGRVSGGDAAVAVLLLADGSSPVDDEDGLDDDDTAAAAAWTGTWVADVLLGTGGGRTWPNAG